MSPKVSICVPNLNMRRFLPDRFSTIFNQTIRDWELIVFDSYSDDGSWEYIKNLAVNEPRMHISQGPREGVYPGWNACIKQAQGEYIYIATSDDTMEPDFLKIMVETLDRNSDCDIAHCCLEIIDEHSNPHPTVPPWKEWPSTKYYGNLISDPHKRPPCHDTVVCFAFRTVYTSVTQILIRKSLFTKVGYFDGRWGPFGDLEWQMRASLVTSTVHIPKYLAQWRYHSNHSYANDSYQKALENAYFIEIGESVIDFSKKVGRPCSKGLPHRLCRFFINEHVEYLLAKYPSRYNKLWCIVIRLGLFSRMSKIFLKDYIKRKLRISKDRNSDIRNELRRLRIKAPVIICNE